jgi:hypothetical protein
MAFRNKFRILESSSSSDEMYDTHQLNFSERDRIIERSPKSQAVHIKPYTEHLIMKRVKK